LREEYQNQDNEYPSYSYEDLTDCRFNDDGLIDQDPSTDPTSFDVNDYLKRIGKK